MPLGGFEQWAQVCGGILHAAGITGFLANLEQLYDHGDEEAAAWQAFLAAWLNGYGDRAIRVGTLAADLPDAAMLRDALPDDLALALDRGAGSFKAKLGRALGKRADTRYGDNGLRVERADQDARSSITSWRVIRDADPADVQRWQSTPRQIPTRTSTHPRTSSDEISSATSTTSARHRDQEGNKR